MICPNCQAENQEGSQRCVKCFQPLFISSENPALDIDPVENKWISQGLEVPWVAKKNNRKLMIIIGIGGLILSGVLFIKGLFLPSSSSNSGQNGNNGYSLTTLKISPEPTGFISITPTISASSDNLRKYDTDKNGDYIPDFVEEALGWDPTINSCTQDLCNDARAEMIMKAQTNLLFILDSSGSMGEKLPEGKTKMDIAKRVLKEYISKLPNNIYAGLLVYGHKGSNSTSDRKLSCQSSELLYSLELVDKEKFNQAVDSFQPTGWTPISSSLKLAQESVFKGRERDNNFIILISDGEETCGGDPCQTTKSLKDSGIQTRIDTVGLGVDQNTRNQLSCIAREGGGNYFDANSYEKLREAFKASSQRIIENLNVIGCVAKNYVAYVGCTSARVNKVNSYLVKLSTSIRKEKGGKDPELKKISEVQRKIFSNYRSSGRETTEEFQNLSKKYYEQLKMEMENWR